MAFSDLSCPRFGFFLTQNLSQTKSQTKSPNTIQQNNFIWIFGWLEICQRDIGWNNTFTYNDILEAFGIPFCQSWLIFHFAWNEGKMACFELCFLFVLMQNEDIWNFYGSLTLNKGKLIWYSGSFYYAIVKNMTNFSLFGMREENGLFWTMCFICTDTKWRHLEFSWLTDFE